MTRQLVVKGTSDGPELDLCKGHDRKMLKVMRAPRRSVKAKLKKQKRTAKRLDYEKDVCPRVLKFMNKTKVPVNAAIIKDMLKLSSHSVANKAVMILIKSGKLKSTGIGPARKLELAA